MIQQAKLPTDISRSKEVEALCRLHGYTKKRALEVVGLDPRRFGNVTRGKIDYLPTPDCVDRMTLEIRDGDVFVSKSSFNRWAEIRATIAAMVEVEAEPDDFDLGGRIADDDVELPAWLYSGGREG